MPPRHIPGRVLQEAVVFEDLRLLYVPVRKAASTAILWALAETTGPDPEDFVTSSKLEVTRSLAVHDTSIWDASHGLAGRSAAELEQILWSDEWFRLAVVREPVRRLWSTWASKILTRDPRFVAVFGSERWFPQAPSTSDDVVHSFRRFVCVLPTRPADWHDPHWSSQIDALGIPSIGYGHVGRLERIDETVSVLADHVRARGYELPPLEHENASLIPFHPGLLEGPSLDACLAWTARDRETFGYEVPAAVAAGTDETWHAEVTAALPAIRAVIERNQRVADLRGMLAEARKPKGALARVLSRVRSG